MTAAVTAVEAAGSARAGGAGTAEETGTAPRAAAAAGTGPAKAGARASAQLRERSPGSLAFLPAPVVAEYGVDAAFSGRSLLRLLSS